MARAPYDDQIDRLYQLPLDEFTTARNVLAKEAGKDAEWTFTIDKDTKVVGKGASTKTAEMKKEGKTTTITDFVKEGDQVRVSYHDMGATKHAANVTVTASIPAKK